MSVFLDAWVDGRVHEGAHTLCKWMSSCVSLGWCLSLFSSLPTPYEKGVQVVWGAFDERPGVCVVFSGDLGVVGGVPFFHTQHHQNHGRTSFENKGGSGRILQGGGTSGETIGEQGKVCVLCVAGARARKSFFLICLYFHAF